MSATTDELPVYTVTGANWDCDVQLDPDDAECTREIQVVEAATKAIEVFKGITENESFRITDDQDAPYLGATVHVRFKGTNPDKGFFVYSHIALANGGFYKDSFEAYKVISDEAKRLDELAKESQENIDNLKEDLKRFDRLKKDVKSGKLSKTLKKSKNAKRPRKNK
jgi:hypothetical protein